MIYDIYRLSCSCLSDDEEKTEAGLCGPLTIRITESPRAPPHSIPVFYKRFTCASIQIALKAP